MMLVRLQFIADVLALDISLCQAIASQLAGLTLHGIVHLCSQNEHLLAVFFFFFFLGYRGIVHPPSDDEGTERTWFEPEQRPRKRVPKRVSPWQAITARGKQYVLAPRRPALMARPVMSRHKCATV